MRTISILISNKANPVELLALLQNKAQKLARLGVITSMPTIRLDPEHPCKLIDLSIACDDKDGEFWHGFVEGINSCADHPAMVGAK